MLTNKPHRILFAPLMTLTAAAVQVLILEGGDLSVLPVVQITPPATPPGDRIPLVFRLLLPPLV